MLREFRRRIRTRYIRDGQIDEMYEVELCGEKLKYFYDSGGKLERNKVDLGYVRRY